MDAPRWDTGDLLGYAKTFVQVALADERIGPELAAWMKAHLP